MPRHRIPMDVWTKAGAKNKHKFIPEGEKETQMIFAADCIFIDTDYRPGYGPEPEKTFEETLMEEVTEPEVVEAPKPKPKKKSKKKSKKKPAKKKTTKKH
jgi:hypothetical protein